MVKLTNKALSLINKPRPRRRLMEVLDCTEQTIRLYIKDNSDNLTKASALQVIREETGLENHEILEPAQAEKEPQS